jgi:glycosyltransferase involved in cell wall biosynthesis/SAM-dependent methyltransferase
MVKYFVSKSPEEPLKFTGERYTSAASGEIKHEHYHRYLFSLQFCHGKTVLDIASGEGYGSALLGIVAEQVLGIDIAPEAVDHASRTYGTVGVSFVVGDCAAIPLSDTSVDVVVSFETLEHVADQERFLCEIKRVLRPTGLLVMSTPNTEVYKEIATEPNPFHIHELDVNEFNSTLGKHFSYHRLLGQRSVIGSVIAPQSAILSEADLQQTFRARDPNTYSVEPGIGPPAYLIAVASDVPLPEIQHGLLDDRPFLMSLYKILQDRAIAVLEVEHQKRLVETIRDGLQEQIRGRDSELTEVRSQLLSRDSELLSRHSELTEVRSQLLSRHSELTEVRSQLLSRVNQLVQSRALVSQLRNQLLSRDDELVQSRALANQLRDQLRSREAELAHFKALVASIYGSASWRVTRPLRFLWDTAREFKVRSAKLVGGLRAPRLLAHTKLDESPVAPAHAGDATFTVESSTATSTEIVTEVETLRRSGLFDEQFYSYANPDVVAAKISPLEHYMYVGAFEGRWPNQLFDSTYYLSSYPDVAKAGLNPALHYFLRGAFECRNPSAEFDTSFYLQANPDVASRGINPLVHFLSIGAKEGRSPLPKERYQLELRELQRLARARHRQEKLDYRPLLSVLMPSYDTGPIYLETAVRSVMKQAYPNWELRIVDDGSSNAQTLASLDRIATWDNRIFLVRNAQNRGISSATNDALRDARGEYVTMLDHDDELTPDALYEVVLALNADRTTDVVYTDQDYISPAGEPAGHLFKPDWSPTLLRGVMYVGHLLTVRRSLALEVGGFDSAFDLVQDFEFMLRISERTRSIRHVPKVLYHWRRLPESVAGGGKADGTIERLQAAAVQAHLERLKLNGFARPNPRHPHRVLIELGQQSLNATFDLIVVQGWCNPVATETSLKNAFARTEHQWTRVAVPSALSGAKFAANGEGSLKIEFAERSLCDAKRLSRFLSESSAEFVLVMSGDVTIETDSWMESLMQAAQDCDVAATCPAVLSSEGFIAHAGLVVGSDGEVRPAMEGYEPESDGYAGSLSCAREISAAWAEVVLLRRSLLVRFLPSNPVYVTADFLVADLILRATRSGLRAICIPYVRARRRLVTGEDRSDHRLDALVYRDIWSGSSVPDPFYSPNFLNVSADYR